MQACKIALQACLNHSPQNLIATQVKKSAVHKLRKACMAAGLRMVVTGNKKNLHSQKRLTAVRLKENMHVTRSRELLTRKQKRQIYL